MKITSRRATARSKSAMSNSVYKDSQCRQVIKQFFDTKYIVGLVICECVVGICCTCSRILPILHNLYLFILSIHNFTFHNTLRCITLIYAYRLMSHADGSCRPSHHLIASSRLFDTSSSTFWRTTEVRNTMSPWPPAPGTSKRFPCRPTVLYVFAIQPNLLKLVVLIKIAYSTILAW